MGTEDVRREGKRNLELFTLLFLFLKNQKQGNHLVKLTQVKPTLFKSATVLCATYKSLYFINYLPL